MAGLSSLLLDDVGELLDLSLGSEECAELASVIVLRFIAFAVSVLLAIDDLVPCTRPRPLAPSDAKHDLPSSW